MTMMCRCLSVSRSGFYAWLTRKPSALATENAALTEEIKEVFETSRRKYGSPRVYDELVDRGHEINIKRVARIMREEGLVGRQKRKFVKTTDSDHDNPIADNLLQREFEVDKPDVVWVGDITYIRTRQGWLYLAIIIDLFSRKVVGWSMANHMRTELALDALQAALGSRTPDTDGLIFHSDRGSQYASDEYRETLSCSGITPSMSRRANCWDNAVAESFFSTLKIELLYSEFLMDSDLTKTTIAEWIEIYYNRKRRHSTNGGLTPADYERHYDENVNIALAA